jgi:hypothetical protein
LFFAIFGFFKNFIEKEGQKLGNNNCNGVQNFINFITSISRNISGGGIRCPYRRCKNKMSLHPDDVTIHLLHKGFMEEYLC